MEYRILGKSDLRVSSNGFGCMSLDPRDIRSEILLHHALDVGINFYDTADLYQQGLNETLLSRAFRGNRNRIILSTKVGNRWKPDGSGWDWVPTKKYILSAIDQSLRRLQTDYIDLYMLHGGTLQDPVDEIIEAFEILRSTGKIRYYGISSIRPNVIREWVNRSSIVSVMMQYSLLDRRPEEEMLSFLQQNQVGILARGSIAKGLLVSKPAEDYLNYSVDQVEKVLTAIKKLAGNSYKLLEIAVQYVLQHPPVCSAVIGIRTEAQLLEAIALGQATTLNEKQMEILGSILPANKYLEHR